MFSVGVWGDSFLRSRGKDTCFGCNNLECKLVTLADNPKIFFGHPIEVTKDIFFSE